MDQQPVSPINIILASNSPRRKQLLQDAGVQFRVFTPTEPVDETLDADLLAQPEEAVKKLAERKAGAAVQEVLAQNPVGLGFVIGADTMVVLDGEISLELDDGQEVLLKKHDVAVQQGNRHAWRNRGDKPATMLFVLMGKKRAA